MKIKYILAILVTMAVTGTSFGQGYQVKWGPEFRQESRLFAGYKFLEIGEDSYWVLQETNDETTIAQYSFDHRLVSVKSLGFRTQYDRLLLQDVVHTATGTFLLLHQFDFDRKVWRMLASRFEQGRFSDPVVVYEERQNIKKSDFRRLEEMFEHGLADPPVMSEDSTKLALINILRGEDYKEDEYITVAVFDADFNLEWQTYHKYKFSQKDFDITQKAVSSFGEAFLVGWTHKDREGPKRGAHSLAYLPEYEYKLFEIRKDVIVQDIVNIGDYVAPLDVALFFPDPNNREFLLTGFYTDDNHKTQQKGLFFATGHPESGLLSSKLTEFEPRFVARLENERAVSKGKGLDLSFNINELVRFDNGNMGFIAEKNYVTFTSNNDYYYPYYGYNYYRYNNFYGYNQREPVYHTDDIIIPVFTPEGEIVKIETIEKEFTSSSDINTSYSFARANDKIYLIFNDRKSRDERKETNKRGSRFTDLVVIDNKGNIESQTTLFTNKELDLDFVTRKSDHNEDVMLIASESNRKYAFGLLPLK